MDGENKMANPLILAHKKGTKGSARGTHREKEKERTTRQKGKGKVKEKHAPKRSAIVLNRVATARNLVTKAENVVNDSTTKNKKPNPPIPTMRNIALTFTWTKPS